MKTAGRTRSERSDCLTNEGPLSRREQEATAPLREAALGAGGPILLDDRRPSWLSGERAERRARRSSAVSERALDLALAVLLLILFAPLMVLVATLVKLNSRGPVLFRQDRLGRRMSSFRVIKFRTMRTGVSSDIHQRYIAGLTSGWAGPGAGGLRKLTNDPRVTSVGRLLRRLSIDELPQLFNVLRGEMSLVGPRPALAYELEHYSPDHFERFTVRPGVTGLWQVSGRSRLGFQEMLDLDAEYARTATLLGDLRILVRTPRAAIGRTA
jgi:lipopolysaccharide/colanic/teichoic acid biosynthesis glycosyltransferase